jgi:hypothetical protein
MVSCLLRPNTLLQQKRDIRPQETTTTAKCAVPNGETVLPISDTKPLLYMHNFKICDLHACTTRSSLQDDLALPEAGAYIAGKPKIGKSFVKKNATTVEASRWT